MKSPCKLLSFFVLVTLGQGSHVFSKQRWCGEKEVHYSENLSRDSSGSLHSHRRTTCRCLHAAKFLCDSLCFASLSSVKEKRKDGWQSEVNTCY
uniref:Putative secreted protein n=1 Tax=Amblyomma cajennense TaxID=34607 RepID=A0A023FDN0_AMBCJ